MYSTSMKKLLSLLTVFALVFGMIAMVRPMQANAATVEIPISNGDFENGAFGGAVSANGAATIVDNKNVHSGNYSVHLTKDGTNPHGSMTITVYPEATDTDRTLTMKFWMMIPSGAAANSVHTQFLAWREWGSLLSEKYGAQYVTANGTWYEKTVSVPVPANTGIVQVQLYAADTGTTPYIDDISMVLDGTDLMTNGGLENGVLNGGISTSSGSIELIHQPVHSGVYAAHADKANGGMIRTTVSVEPSAEARTMNLSYWLYVTPGATNSAHNGVFSYDTISNAPNWTMLSQKYSAQYATPGVWTQKTLPVAVAANTDTVQIQIYGGEAGADFYIDDLTLTEEVAFVNHDVTLSLNQVTGDGTWQFSISEAPANKYYKVPATIDGTACNVLMGESGGVMCIYPSFFTALGGVVPTQQIIIEEGAVLKAVDSANGWQEIEGADTLTIAEKIDLSYVNGAWSKTVYTTNVEIIFNQVTSDGTWQFGFTPAPAEKFYKVPAIVDGTACNVLMGEAGGIMCVYPNFFTAIGGVVPTESLVIPAGTVMYAVDSTNGWQVIDGANTLTVTNGLSVEYNLGTWQDMSQYADVTFEEITASDLIVYKWEDQAASNYRSVLGIYAPNAQFGNDANWGNFTKVAGKVLIDGAEVSVVYGMAPATDSSWAADNAIMLYITGDGYWDAVTTASSVTICAGTMLVSGVDNTKGVKFAEDFTMYKNCDGSWDTTADTHVYNQQNTELEGALATEANCQSAATYYYSCFCGKLGSETFSSGELGNHNFVNGSCSVCGQAAQSITISFQTVAADGTWQLIPSAAPADSYYKANVLIDGKEYAILMQYSDNMLLIYPNFFTALSGAVPAESTVIPANTELKPVTTSSNGWVEIEDAATLLVTAELKVENIAGKWFEMSKYSNVEFKEIYGADLDLYYQNIMRLSDYSDSQINTGLLLYPEYRELYDHYGRDANMTTFGFVPNIPTLQIPNDANWTNFTLLGTVSVAGAEPWETYMMQTPDSSDDAETAMTNGFLVRFYNGYVADQATSVTIEPGTKIVTKDGTAGFVFVDGYTIYRDENGNWSDVAPAGTNPVSRWSLLLADNIGVVFEMNVAETDTVTFTVNGTPVTAQKDGNTYTVYLAAAQMTDQIEVFVNGVAVEKTYSVRAYADIILSGGYGDLVVNLVKQMLNYGAASQTVFSYNTTNLANSGIDVTASVPTGDGEIQVSGNVDGITFYGASLLHRTKTAVRIYFAAQSVKGLTFTANGVPCNASQKDGLFYVEVAGINPQDLGSDVAVTVSNGTDTLSIAYSPMDYIVRMYEKAGTADNTKALVQALYGYYLAAVDYTA